MNVNRHLIFILLTSLMLWLAACQSANEQEVAVAVALTQTAAAVETDAAATPTALPPTATVQEQPTAEPTATVEPTTAPEATATSTPDTDPAVAALLEQAGEWLGVQPDDPAFDGLQAVRIFTPDGQERWLVHTVGMRDFENDRYHGMAIFAPNGAGAWQLQAQVALNGDPTDANAPAGPDFLPDNGVTQVEITPDRIWLQVEGGAGAHSGVFQIYSFDGTAFKLEADGFSSSPGVGSVRDLNGDGIGEVLLDATDYYVFCYACGVREVTTQILRWDGEELAPVELTPLDDSAPAELRELNNHAVELADAGLWKDAQITISEAESLSAGDDNSVFAWNVIDIGLIAQERQLAIGSMSEDEQIGYPILGNIFYGDYDAAVDVMRAYSPTLIFSDTTPLIVGTVAEGWEVELSDRISSTVALGLNVEPDNAAAHFLSGWALWLQDAPPSEVLTEITAAAQLAPDDEFYAAAVAFLGGEETPTAADTPVPGADGGTIYFSAQDRASDKQNIYAFDIGGEDATLVVEEGIQPRMRPDGALLAFHSTRGDMLGLNGYNLDTDERARLSTFVEDSYPTWSPAGDELIFASNREGDRAWRLYRSTLGEAPDASANEEQVLTFGQEPDWSPDGSQIVYRGCDNSGDVCGLWLMDAEGGESQLLTDNRGDARPRWAPDGSFIIFMSDQRDDNWELYRVDIAESISDSPVTRLTDDPANDGLPAISPDGTQVAFVSNRGDGWGLWQIPAQGGTATQLTAINGQMPNWLEEGVDWPQ